MYEVFFFKLKSSKFSKAESLSKYTGLINYLMYFVSYMYEIFATAKHSLWGTLEMNVENRPFLSLAFRPCFRHIPKCQQGKYVLWE